MSVSDDRVAALEARVSELESALGAFVEVSGVSSRALGVPVLARCLSRWHESRADASRIAALAKAREKLASLERAA